MKDKGAIKGFIFDMDGTLLDTERLYRRIWLELSKERGYVLTDEMLDRMRGAALSVGAKIFEEANPGFDFASEREIRTQRVFQYMDTYGVPKKPGLDTLFHWLKERRYKVALGSSTPRAQVMRYLGAIDYVEKFDSICTGEMVERGKPEPDLFLLCAEKMGLKPMECVVVEDSYNGIRAGFAAGCYVIGIPDLNDLSPVRAYMDAELSSLTEIIKHL